MNTAKLTAVALALAAAMSAAAAEPSADVKKEIQALKERMAELEKAAAAAGGMTPEQKAEFDRIAVKAEALEDGRDASGLKGFKISGYMDPSYVYNANKQRGSFQFVVPISKEPYGYDNGYFGTMALDVVKETDNGTKFHLTLYPKRGGADVMGENGILHEASVWIPLGGLSTKLFAGQLPDWSGYEYYAPHQYKNITHNMLFDFTLPAAYTGAGIELIRGKWDVKLMLANVNASVRSVGEHIPMFVFRVDYAGGEYWGLGAAGAEGWKANVVNGGKDTRYDSIELDGYYTRANVTLNGHIGYGQQQKAAIAATADGTLQTAQWAGVSALAAYKFTPRLEGVLRGDFIWNERHGGGLLDYGIDPGNGIGPAEGGAFVLSDPLDPNSPLVPDFTDPVWKKGANKFALTAGLSYALNANVLLKLEYRFDGATQKVFGNKDLLAEGSNPKYLKYNSLGAAAVVFSF